ncbi:MAG TPA: reverse transcriptase/maturase family protein [Chitinophagaceae bacterium]|nr:reverse transcriptase/maturase family protein [Chitinophagaceae bacterium]
MATESDLIKQRLMKRFGSLYNHICSMENLLLADMLASKGKSKQKGVIRHKQYQEAELTALRTILVNKQFKTSSYTTFKIYEPKERLVYRLPYYPDRIVQHAIMNVLEPYFLSIFTADTYSCIKGKGIHGAVRAVKRALKDKEGTTYCLKLDIRKFYPSVNHEVLKELLRRKFKDQDLLHLLDGIIDSAEGLPIGNYLSQYLANFYLSYFDHWLKECKAVRYYFRYADDMVILSSNKEALQKLLQEIRKYLYTNLRLIVKDNYQVFPVDARGIDFLGYRFYHDYTLLRKSIKQNFARMLATHPTRESIAGYTGWAKHCNSKHLLKKLKIKL